MDDLFFPGLLVGGLFGFILTGIFVVTPVTKREHLLEAKLEYQECVTAKQFPAEACKQIAEAKHEVKLEDNQR